MLSTLLQFFTGATKHAQLDPELLKQEGPSARQHQTYHRLIVWISLATGVIVDMICVPLLASESSGDSQAIGLRDLRLYAFSPLLFGAMGVLLGASAACAVAPRAFLTGPIGERWLRLAGVNSVGLARVVFITLAILLAAVVTFILLSDTLVAHGILPAPKHHQSLVVI